MSEGDSCDIFQCFQLIKAQISAVLNHIFDGVLKAADEFELGLPVLHKTSGRQCEMLANLSHTDRA